MVKVVDGGQCAATRARFSPGVRIGLHVVAAEATDTPRPITIETAKTSKSLFKFPLKVAVSSFLSMPHDRCPRIDPQAEQFHADSPSPRSDQPPAALLWGTS